MKKDIILFIMKYKNIIYHFVVLAGLITFFTLYMNEKQDFRVFRESISAKFLNIHDDDMKIVKSIINNQNRIIANQDSIKKQLKILKELK